jgi:hypothetical protein
MSQVSISPFDRYRGGSGRFADDLTVVSVIPQSQSANVVSVTMWTPLSDASKLFNT